MSTAVVFLDIEKAFDTTWHLGLLYKLSTLQFSISLIKLIGSFLSQRKFWVSFEGQISTPKDIQVGILQGSVLSPTLHSLYINDMPQTSGVYLCLFADYICACAKHRKECCVLRKLQRGLIAIETWCECWKIRINEDKNQAFYHSHRLRPSEACLTLNGRNHRRYLGVIFDKKVTWRMRIEMIEAKAFRTFTSIYS
jgi:hypothetical protein